MPLNGKPSRYAHPEGHTDVCYFTGEKGGLLTCGSDGDVRSWLNLMDDDPDASCISEQVISVVSKNDKIYVATDNNTVQILTYPDLEKEGIITRFSATVCALASSKNGNLIVSGACDMRIQVSNIQTCDSIELNGHQGPILGLSLDPQEQFVASSSTDGSIRVWDIKEKQVAHIWNNVVPKGNSFFTSKTYSTPSFQCEDGKTLAFPQGKEVVVVERGTWKELFKLRCPDLKAELSICKFSQCGTLLAASSIHGEIVVWEIESKEQIGYITHDRNAKITSIAWSPNLPNEIAFCDSLGMLGCVDVVVNSVEELFPKTVDSNQSNQDLDNFIENYKVDDDNDDGENVISLDKIKASVQIDYDDDSQEPIAQRPEGVDKKVSLKVEPQEPFQPGSSPTVLLNRYMAWNNTGVIKCYSSEDGQESSIEVEFHDASIHHPIHIDNYLQHTLASLSPKALALACVDNGDTPSKLVVVRLQGWGSGTKEWSINFPQGELPLCVASGDNFVAVATSKRRLRLFTASGTQRRIIALPGAPVAINALGNQLVAVCHAGLSGVQKEQHMTMIWLQIRGSNIRNRSLAVPLSGPELKLAWVGLTDRGSPTVMDEDGVISIYDAKSSLWNVACDTANQCKGAADRFFVIGISEIDNMVRCILCKGCPYPQTTPTPTQIEIPLELPVCDPESVKSKMEAKLWQLGTDPSANDETLLSMFVLACRGNAEYRAVDLCEELASQKVLELAVKYAGRLGQMALVTKLQSLARTKEDQDINEENGGKIREREDDRLSVNQVDEEFEEVENADEYLSLTPIQAKPAVEIRPMSLSMKRQNPFKKNGKSPSLKGLQAMNRLPENPRSSPAAEPPPQKPKPKPASKSNPAKESFVVWFGKHNEEIAEEFPEVDNKRLTMIALERYKENEKAASAVETSLKERETKKRKLSDAENEKSQSTETIARKLSTFAYTE
ncbi:WD repeat and HMG-box DNA-binding protein 1 isoform X1 [Neodiprion pinetum]|uniref:WD repeat and HMG-box DNA-binding protein 1 isoform X1 n=1 Tax=Neodiprion pinetum TaxID=441929 RepID=UPI001EDE1DA8|nr:WD repeat and HMG-box DNA-binding protein 1 isoform X1 [Neodiprion pinetum]